MSEMVERGGVDWFQSEANAGMTLPELVEAFQRYEDAIAFGSAFLQEHDGQIRAVHPAECVEGFDGAWRLVLYTNPDDDSRIFGRIEDEDVIHAVIAGALFLDREPCCGNLEVARQIRAAGGDYYVDEDDEEEAPTHSPMEQAKSEMGYCFADNEKRIEGALAEFGLPVAVGALAAQFADAFEEGYTAGVFDTIVEMRKTHDLSGN